MNQINPKFSVIIGTYQAAETLQATINSIILQDYENWEILISDGASTDGTVEIIQQNASKIAWWTSAPDTGLTQAWNRCLPHATGDWVLFLGADDVLHDSKTLSASSSQLRLVHSDIWLAYGRILFVKHGSDHGIVLGSEWKKSASKFYLENTLPHQAVFHRKSAFLKFGNFDEAFKITADYEFMLRCVLDKSPHDLGEDLIVTNMADGGISSNPRKTWKVHAEFYRARRKHNLPIKASELILRGRSYLKRALAAILGDKYESIAGRPFLRKAQP